MEKKRRILVVDDDIEIVQFLQVSLEREGYEVMAGRNGKEAITLSQKYNPDLILMDIVMPEMDGLEACKIIKRRETAKFIPIIFLTVKGSHDDKVKGLDLGADDYLAKPFKINELAARVRSMLRIKQLTEQLQETKRELIEAKQVAAVAATAVTVNHNINTPLTTIMANVELLSTKLPGSARPVCKPYLNDIKTAAKRISRLTKKLAKLEKPNFVDYLAGTSMLDLDG
ncbi:MAG: response regulator [Deltaproteobacteria bacterium]|nr:response regulator [Deltaproteobacteria bacterium]MBW1738351.1 response regulator [Deltaproteobacteria bacterium]MBW1910937.1 response regulator [Deltaproteobacteria bacterium]MBW2034963.1 response regulator [Deltaproteobacteria bacterium]MBW2115592.1 response regulator [Deltaproteobacteria bacterium]